MNDRAEDFDLPENAVALINEKLDGFDRVMGVHFTRAELGEFVAELEVGEQHYQPYGIVHGGVYSSLVETVCSVASALNVWGRANAVGLENSTSFLKAVRSGRLVCTAKPALLGRRSHVWQAEVHDDRGRLVATGRVRTLILEQGASADGVEVSLPGDPGE